MTVQRLALSWMRRKRWENKMLAGEVVSLLGQAMGGKGKAGGNSGGEPARGVAKVSGGEMLAMMGLQV